MKKVLFAAVIISLYILSGCGQKEKPAAESVAGDKFFYLIVSPEGESEVREHYPGSGSDKLIAKAGKFKVLDMQINQSMSKAFLVVFDGRGTEGLFTVLKGARLLLIDLKSGIIKEVHRLERCIQLYTQWNDDKNYSVTFNTRLPEGEFVTQTEMVINSSGETVFSNENKFDVLKEGYPQLPFPKIYTASKLGKVNLLVDSLAPLSLTFVDPAKRLKRTILKSEGRIRQAEWINNDSLVVFSVEQKDKNADVNQSSVFVFSAEKGDYIKKWSGAGEKFFKITGDYLIFDNRIRNNSDITIYNLKTGKEITLQSGGAPVTLKVSAGVLN